MLHRVSDYVSAFFLVSKVFVVMVERDDEEKDVQVTGPLLYMSSPHLSLIIVSFAIFRCTGLQLRPLPRAT